jgi:predicted DNA-binding transcriptional regulator YafY
MALGRLQRLDEIKGLLRAREFATAESLATALGVSVRTLNRDLSVLRHSGVPIEADRGRGGGLRLHRSWSLGRLQLNPEEAVDLLLCLTIAQQLNSPLLLRQLASIERKIAAAFSDAQQANIRALRKRVLIGKPASEAVLLTLSAIRPKPLPEVSKAFFDQKHLSLRYRDAAGQATTRTVEPQFLYFGSPVWYLLAFDHLRSAIRYFRVDRIDDAKCLDQTFRLADPKAYLAVAEAAIGSL